MRGSEGAFFAYSEKNAPSGSVNIAAIYQSPYTDFNSPLFSFSAETLTGTSVATIGLLDTILEYVELPDSNYFVQI